jgi:thymidylate kinase
MDGFFANLEAALCEADGLSRRTERCAHRPANTELADTLRVETPALTDAAIEQAESLPSATANRGRVVLIEGMDLAGKSTLVRNLQAELTGRGISVRVSRNALCPENPIAAVADELRRDPAAGLLETGASFLASHLWDARHFVAPAPGTIHIQDSCWLRTLSYHIVRGTPQIPELLRRAMPTFPRFDAAIFLTAGIAERRRRLQQREHERPGSNDHGDHAVVRDPELFREFDISLWRRARWLVGAVRVDVTELSEQSLVLRAMQIIEPRLKSGRH